MTNVCVCGVFSETSCVSSFQRLVMRTQCWAIQTRDGSMTWWEARSSAVRATLTGGVSTSTEALRPTSLLTTSSTCFSEVASHPVSEPVCADAHFLSYNLVTPLMTKKVMAVLCCPALYSESTHLQQWQNKLQPWHRLPTRENWRPRRCTCLQFINSSLLFSLMCVCRRGMFWLFHMTLCVCFLQGGFSMFIQLMPIVVLILVSILSQMMVSPPPYSLYSRP